MEAGTLEQPSTDALPVFVAGGRRRNHAVRLAAATLGLLLAAWLVALAAGLMGFSPLPKLTLPGAGTAQTPPPDQASQPWTERGAGASAAPVAARPARGGGEVSAARSAATRGASASLTRTAGGGSASTSPDTGGSIGQSPSTGPAAGTGTQASSEHSPSFTPPVSGEKSADPPRGTSASAPGRTVSAAPPGKVTRPHSG
jgi:hypothetical protein